MAAASSRKFASSVKPEPLSSSKVVVVVVVVAAPAAAAAAPAPPRPSPRIPLNCTCFLIFAPVFALLRPSCGLHKQPLGSWKPEATSALGAKLATAPPPPSSILDAKVVTSTTVRWRLGVAEVGSSAEHGFFRIDLMPAATGPTTTMATFDSQSSALLHLLRAGFCGAHSRPSYPA